MMTKQVLDPHRIRKVPAQFSWIDHRLVRDRHIEYCSHPAAALYLFLVTVSDARGLSYYSDASLIQRLSMDDGTLRQARHNLLKLGLIAYRKPLCQVLALDHPVQREPLPEGPLSMGEILGKIAGGGA